MGRAYIKNEYILEEDFCMLKISGGVYGEKCFKIDIDMVEECKKYKWYINMSKKHKDLNKTYCYARTIGGMLIHRFIVGCSNRNLVVDHINGDTTDNRKENLQVCSGTQNLTKQGFSDRNKSGHKGVLWYHYNNINKWVAYITANKKRKTLGYFDNIEDAINARLKAEKEYFDENFMPIAHTKEDVISQ